MMSVSRHRHTLSSRIGFTLVELLVVVAVLGVLVLMAIPAYNQYITSTKNKRCIGDIRTIDKAITSYYLEKNVYPANLSEVGMGNQRDPWGRPYRYNTPYSLKDSLGFFLNNDYDLYSEGKDGASSDDDSDPSSADDIVRMNSGVYAGERS
jgi:prepilin-type N-terminal cleavage/methylation domain-containing protein